MRRVVVAASAALTVAGCGELEIDDERFREDGELRASIVERVGPIGEDIFAVRVLALLDDPSLLACPEVPGGTTAFVNDQSTVLDNVGDGTALVCEDIGNEIPIEAIGTPGPARIGMRDDDGGGTLEMTVEHGIERRTMTGPAEVVAGGVLELAWSVPGDALTVTAVTARQPPFVLTWAASALAGTISVQVPADVAPGPWTVTLPAPQVVGEVSACTAGTCAASLTLVDASVDVVVTAP